MEINIEKFYQTLAMIIGEKEHLQIEYIIERRSDIEEENK